MKVHRLDDLTINQIAAGEVVERPASVVKELVENAIDAGATQIQIEIKNGGRQSIKVVDNGVGMEREDAVLSIERHATSKINQSNDLLNLNSLGFRGEALASIASVSTMNLITKTVTAEFGTMLEIKGGILNKAKNIGAPDGTTIIVEDLFYNTPARLKYLKSIPSETTYISEFVTWLALGHPNISFQLKHHENELLFTSGNGDLRETLIALYGKDTAKEMFAFEAVDHNLKTKGFFGKPSVARANRKQEIFFVNGRNIHSRLLCSAVEKAYRTLLPIARYPFVIVFLEIPPEIVDVNVHPTKLEVRFSNESDIYRFVYHTLHNALKENSLISDWINPDSNLQLPPSSNNYPVAKQMPPQNATINYQNYQEIRSMPSSATAVQERSMEAVTYQPTNENVASAAFAPVTVSSPAPGDRGKAEYRNWYIYPKAASNTYLIVQDEQGLLFIDQHAAHERVLFEKFMKQTAEILDSQALLIPETVTLNYAQYKMVSERLSIFNELGFEIELFGGRSLIIRGVPLPLLNMDYTQIILDLIEEYMNFKTFKNPAEIKAAFIITMACRSAIKAGDKLELMESENLVKDLFNCENPYTCPHGRPTVFRMTFDDLAKKFLRR